MKKNVPFTLSLDTPCGQSWDNMAVAGKGRFCSECMKPVIDFTTMTDAALAAYIEIYGTGCGRFREDQLNRSIVPEKRSVRSYWRQLTVGFGMLLGLPLTAYTQSRTVIKKDQTCVPVSLPGEQAIVPAGKSDSVISVEGEVTDIKGEPIVSASIVILDENGKTIGAAISDFDGLFTISPLGGKQPGEKIFIQANWMHEKQRGPMIIEHFKNKVRFRFELLPVSSHQIIRMGGFRRKKVSAWQKMKYRAKHLFTQNSKKQHY